MDSFCWAAVEDLPTEKGADSAPLHLHKVMMNNNDISKEVLCYFVFVLFSVSLLAVLSLYPSAGCHPHIYSCSLLALHGCPFPILWPQFYHGGTWPLLQPCHPPRQEPHNQTRQRHCRRPTQVKWTEHFQNSCDGKLKFWTVRYTMFDSHRVLLKRLLKAIINTVLCTKNKGLHSFWIFKHSKKLVCFKINSTPDWDSVNLYQKKRI